MSIKNVRMFNDSVRAMNKSAEHMSKAIESNTSEIKKIVKVFEAVREEQRVDWRKVETISESDRYPLVQDSSPSLKMDNAALLLKKLDIL